MELVRQEFNGAVGDVAARDIINHHHTHGRLLTKAERFDLNHLVQRLQEEFGEPGWQTWKFLHRTIGVEKIEEMRLGHRDQAETILTLLLEKATHKKAYDTHGEKLGQYATANAALSAQSKDLSQKYQQLQQAYRTLESRLTAPRKTDTCHRCQDLSEKNGQIQQAYKALESRLVAAKKESICQQCSSAKLVVRNIRHKLLLITGVALLSLSGTAYFGYRSASTATALAVAEARMQTCEYDGKPYSIGSVIDNKGSPDIECLHVDADSPPAWRPAKIGAEKKGVKPRRPPQRTSPKDEMDTPQQGVEWKPE